MLVYPIYTLTQQILVYNAKMHPQNYIWTKPKILFQNLFKKKSTFTWLNIFLFPYTWFLIFWKCSVILVLCSCIHISGMIIPNIQIYASPLCAYLSAHFHSTLISHYSIKLFTIISWLEEMNLHHGTESKWLKYRVMQS